MKSVNLCILAMWLSLSIEKANHRQATHPRHVVTLPWEIKNSIFWRYLADMEENVNKLHFQCTDFKSSARVTVCWVYLCVLITILPSSQNTMLIVDRHCSGVCCDEFPVPQINRKSKQVKKQRDEKFYLQSVWVKLTILNTENIKICGWIRWVS